MSELRQRFSAPPIELKYERQSDVDSDLTRNQIEWLQKCLPIIVQPKVDIDNGYSFVGAFVEFRTVNNSKSSVQRCDLRLIYNGEASFERNNPVRVNHFGTWLYRSFNYFSFGRTGDINELSFLDCDLPLDSGKPWSRIVTEDFNGEQSWSQGQKGDFFYFYSLDFHYDLDFPYRLWKRRQHRPLLYVNTSNHMHGPHDRNPELLKHVWDFYPVWAGGKAESEMFTRSRIPIKPNLFTALPFLCKHASDEHSTVFRRIRLSDSAKHTAAEQTFNSH